MTDEEYKHNLWALETLELTDQVRAEILEKIKEYEAPRQTLPDSPIYDILVERSRPMSDEKIKCVKDTVNELLKDSENAREPCLLMGYIQSGKTDAFEKIIGLAFDRGIDVAVVFTKNTNILAQQTVSRLWKDFAPFIENLKIDGPQEIKVQDIMDSRAGFRQDGSKIILVCKKQVKNLERLIELFQETNTWLLNRRVLIIDDEADFTSINYVIKENEEGREAELAKVARQMNEFRILTRSRYLQVTATPYSLFLQPDGKIQLGHGHAEAFRPRFCALLPAHDKYIGGAQYFGEESRNTDSMYYNLYYEITEKCVRVLGTKNRHYLNNCIRSKNILPFTRALLAYFIATAIRTISWKRKTREWYRSSAVIHVDVGREQHFWQEELTMCVIEGIKKNIFEDFAHNSHLAGLYASILADFQESNEKAIKNHQIDQNTDVFPSSGEIIKTLKEIFDKDHCRIKVINSDEDLAAALDGSGQLKLEKGANIFIGGQILDRGITIPYMLCFFYGRDPGTFQQNTVIQHMRQYGARDLEDMAVTRFYTTNVIHNALVQMYEINEALRKRVEDGLAPSEIDIKFVGFDRTIRPCAPGQIRLSQTYTVKPGRRYLPRGFFTGSDGEIRETVGKIRGMIEEAPGHIKDGFFLMDGARAIQILQLISKTFVYNKKHENLDYVDDMMRLDAAMAYCLSEIPDKRLYVLHREGRDASRLSTRVRQFEGSPDNGGQDTAPARAIAIDRPVLMLLGQNGAENETDVDWSNKKQNIGWNDTPFYWPVLLTQSELEAVLFAREEMAHRPLRKNEESPLIKGMNKSKILSMSWQRDLEEEFGQVGTKYGERDDKYIPIPLKKTTANQYIETNKDDGEWLEAEGTETTNLVAGIYSFNNGHFPYELHPFKYILLTHDGSQMLLKLAPKSQWRMEHDQTRNNKGELLDPKTEDVLFDVTDKLINPDMSIEEFIDQNICLWSINYKISEVVGFLRAPN